MARLTLSEQVNALASKNAELTAMIHAFEAQEERLQASVKRLQEEADKVPGLVTKIAELTKDRDSQKSLRDMYEKAATKAEAEVEQAHAVLDGVEGAPPREYETSDSYGSSKKQRYVVTRLAGAFLSIAQRGASK
jgi:uncharacterized coiled-coil DUF342 family protein